MEKVEVPLNCPNRPYSLIVAACVLYNFFIRNQVVKTEEIFEPENEGNYMEDDGFEHRRGTIGKRKRNYIVSILH